MRFILILSIIFLSMSVSAQSKEMWATLSMVKTEKNYDEFMGMEVTKSKPMPPAVAMDGREIEISGYMISLTADPKPQSHFMFSRYPQNMCFFCGAAGPESAMQVFMQSGTKAKYQKEKVKVKGRLQIQTNDSSGLIYFLQDAVIIE